MHKTIFLNEYFAAEILELVTEYQGASTERKQQLEQCYGKKQLQTLVENAMSENWIKNNSQKCPKCQAAIEVFTYMHTYSIYLQTVYSE